MEKKQQTKGIVIGVGIHGELAEVTILVAADDARAYGERIGRESLVTIEEVTKLKPVKS